MDDLNAPSELATIVSPAIECPSNICLGPGPGNANAQGIEAVCSASCESNDDCEDGEIAHQDDPSDHRCKSGFACMWPTTIGNFACRSLCVCRDLFTDPEVGYRKHPACP